MLKDEPGRSLSDLTTQRYCGGGHRHRYLHFSFLPVMTRVPTGKRRFQLRVGKPGPYGGSKDDTPGVEASEAKLLSGSPISHPPPRLKQAKKL